MTHFDSIQTINERIINGGDIDDIFKSIYYWFSHRE